MELSTILNYEFVRMEFALALVSYCALMPMVFALAYLGLIAVASAKRLDRQLGTGNDARTRFAISVPAHNEEAVIASSVKSMKAMDYPEELFDIHVVADHCSDGTEVEALRAGAVVHSRDVGPRGGKGSALRYLFSRILNGGDYDAVVVFDADTRPSVDFLRVMEMRLISGEVAIQGRHEISNHHEGWYPALIWAMFMIDNRFQNQGRANLGWSAKHMGDSICFSTDILTKVGWGRGLTEDYHLRQRLLLMGVKIAYEPRASGLGQAPVRLNIAAQQRARWLSGSLEANRENAKRLFVEGVRRREVALLDGAMQAYIPSYSTLSLISVIAFSTQLLGSMMGGPSVPVHLMFAWGIVILGLMGYPFLGLLLEGAPLKAYLAILLGPLFILWRSYLALKVRISGWSSHWVRTPHKEVK